MNPLRLTHDMAEQAAALWNFNCGPAAICAALDMLPCDLRPHMLDFETKGYTNPTLMFDVLKRLGVKTYTSWRNDSPGDLSRFEAEMPDHGLVRVQFAGPWTRPGVPMRVRYRKTHWAASRANVVNRTLEVFDVNALEQGGWIEWTVWATRLMPWIARTSDKKADGTWWPTHCIEIEPTPKT